MKKPRRSDRNADRKPPAPEAAPKPLTDDKLEAVTGGWSGGGGQWSGGGGI
jgi:bacteriocin-like protein